MRDLFRRTVEQNWSVVMVIAGSLAIAYLLGYGVAFQSSSGVWILFAVGGILLIAVTLAAPIEVMILAGMLGPILADSRIVPGALVYYARFVPMGMLTIRTILDFLIKRNPILPITKTFVLPSLPILLIAFTSSIYGIDPVSTFQKSVSMLFVLLSFGIGLPAFWQTSERAAQGLKWVTTLLVSVLLVGLILYDLNPQYAFYQETYVRLQGIFGNPNTQGLIAMLCLFPALWWWQTENHPTRKMLVGLAVLLTLGEVIAAGSRGSFLGVAAGGLGLLWLRERISVRNMIILSSLLLGATTFALVEPTFGRILQVAEDSSRIFLWQRSIELGMNSPIWGVGLGASDLIYRADQPYLLSIGMATGGSHSSYFRMFVDLGLVGVMFGFWVFIIVLARVFTSKRNIQRDGMVAFLTASVISGLVNAAFEDWLFGFGSASTPIMWFFVALLALRVEMLGRENQVPNPPPSFSSPLLRRVQH